MLGKSDLSLKDLVRAFGQQPAYRERLNQARIRVFWKEEMGKTFNEAVKSIYLKNRVLYLNVHSSVVRQELQYSKEALLRRLNQLLEEDYLREVVIN